MERHPAHGFARPRVVASPSGWQLVLVKQLARWHYLRIFGDLGERVERARGVLPHVPESATIDWLNVQYGSCGARGVSRMCFEKRESSLTDCVTSSNSAGDRRTLRVSAYSVHAGIGSISQNSHHFPSCSASRRALAVSERSSRTSLAPANAHRRSRVLSSAKLTAPPAAEPMSAPATAPPPQSMPPSRCSRLSWRDVTELSGASARATIAMERRRAAEPTTRSSAIVLAFGPNRDESFRRRDACWQPWKVLIR